MIAELAVSLQVYTDARKNFTLIFFFLCILFTHSFAFVTAGMWTRAQDYEPYMEINFCRCHFCIYFTHKTM